MLTESARNPPKLFRCLCYVFAANIVAILQNELFHLVLKLYNFSHGQRDFALPFSRPHQRSIKRFRCKVGGKKGDGIKSGHACRRHRSTKVPVIGFLDRGAAGDFQSRLLRHGLPRRLGRLHRRPL